MGYDEVRLERGGVVLSRLEQVGEKSRLRGLLNHWYVELGITTRAGGGLAKSPRQRQPISTWGQAG